MFNKEELELINEIISPMVFEDENKKKLQIKLGLVVKQLEISSNAQIEMAKIQDKIMELGKDEDKEEE